MIKRILFLGIILTLQSCVINNPTEKTSVEKTIVVDSIYEGGVKDIVFAEENGDFYYINRGLEQGFTIEGLETQVLNKTVTLHLANTIWGNNTPHIAQLALNDSLIYSEFK